MEISVHTFSEKMTVSVSPFAVLVLTTFLSIQAHAQVAGGTIAGTVSDPSGGIIPNAQITVKNVATGVTRAVSIDGAGFSIVPNLLPGTYEITAAAGGFATEVRTGITLTVGAQQVRD